MARHVIAPVDELPPGSRKFLEIDGRPIAVFNVKGEFFGLLNRCPHQGAALCEGPLIGLASSSDAELLQRLGAFDDRATITPTGRRMLMLGTHPRLAAMLVAARTPREQALAADLAHVVEEQRLHLVVLGLFRAFEQGVVDLAEHAAEVFCQAVHHQLAAGLHQIAEAWLYATAGEADYLGV